MRLDKMHAHRTDHRRIPRLSFLRRRSFSGSGLADGGALSGGVSRKGPTNRSPRSDTRYGQRRRKWRVAGGKQCCDWSAQWLSANDIGEEGGTVTKRGKCWLKRGGAAGWRGAGWAVCVLPSNRVILRALLTCGGGGGYGGGCGVGGGGIDGCIGIGGGCRGSRNLCLYGWWVWVAIVVVAAATATAAVVKIGLTEAR